MCNRSDSRRNLDHRHHGLIDKLCDQFEADWLAEKQPAIETYLGQVDAALREVLLRELLLSEMELRRQANDSVDVEKYKQRFPEQRSLIDRIVSFDASERQELGSTRNHLADTTPRKRPVRTLRSHCPHCRHAMEIEIDAALERLDCPACEGRFSLVNDDPNRAPRVTNIGHFELTQRLGIGGFGVVWKARDTRLDRDVAIKIPRQGQLERTEVEQFLREARAVAQLTHPGIARIHEVGNDGETLYVVSDFIEGVTLAERLESQTFSPHEAANLCAQIANALQHAHEAGIIHRDLKPQNIMLTTEQTPVLVDFGLARRDADDVTITQNGDLLGTPAYMSPEQARGDAHQADRRTDIYSLGAILYQLLTGELPFRGDIRRLIFQVLNEDPQAPRTLNSALPADLETICLKCLEKLPARRYGSAQALACDLINFLEGRAITARPVGRLERTWKWACRRPTIASLLLASTLLLLMVLIGGVSYNRQLRESNDRLKAERDRSVRLYDAGIELGRYTLREHALLLASLPGGSEAQESLVVELLNYLDRLAADAQDDAALELDLADGYARLAAVQGDPSAINRGQIRRAMESYQKSLAIWQRIHARQPADQKTTLNYAAVLGGLGSVKLAMGETSQATEHLTQAVKLLRPLVERDANAHEASLLYSTILVRLAGIRESESKYDRALELLQQSLACLATSRDADQQRLLSGQTNLVHLKLGMLSMERANKENAPQLLLDARPHFEAAIEHLNAGHWFPSQLAPERLRLAELLLQYGEFVRATDGPRAALAYQQRALALHREHRAHDRHSVTVRRELSRALTSVARLHQELGQWATAIELLREALAISEQLAQADVENRELQRDLWVDLNDLGTALLHTGTLDEAEHPLRTAHLLAEQLAATDDAESHVRLASACERLGTLSALRGNAEISAQQQHYLESLDWFRRSVTAYRRTTKLRPLTVDEQEALETVQRMCQQLEQAIDSPEARH